jgi:hypothetical protein
MIDLDAPGGPNNNSLSPLLHWLITLSPESMGLPDAANMTVAPYAAPAPPPGSGKHRYTILLLSYAGTVFRIPPTFQGFNTSRIEDRFTFPVSRFIQDGGFELLAATWFTTESKQGAQSRAADVNISVGFVSLLFMTSVFISMAV